VNIFGGSRALPYPMVGPIHSRSLHLSDPGHNRTDLNEVEGSSNSRGQLWLLAGQQIADLAPKR
jgi:hypothetical protein